MDAELRKKLKGTPRKVQAGYLLVLLGLMMEMVAFFTAVGISGEAASYYASAKAARDAAAAGSGLLAQQGSINAVSKWVTALGPTGTSAILVGILLILWSIIDNIRLRGRVMEATLPLLKRQTS